MYGHKTVHDDVDVADLRGHGEERTDDHQVGTGAHAREVAMPRQQQQHHQAGGECHRPQNVV